MTNRQSRFVGSRIRLLAFVLIVPVILSLDSRGVGETVFMNARILSMAASDRVTSLTDIPYYEAMLVRNGRIVQLGSNDSVLDAMSSAARLVDLDERAVLPGFVDAHSHFPVSGLASVSVNVAPPPSGPGGSKEAVLSAIAAAVPKEPATTDAHFILGFNYDNTAFSVPEHPTRAELDAISNGYPVYLWHSSGHLGVANSAALQALNIDEQTEAVIGGERRRDASGRLNGLLLEHAAPSMTTLLKQLSWRERWRIVTAARDEYLMNGVTTVQNGFASTTMQRLLNALHSVKLLPQRPHSWLAHKKLDAAEKNQLDNTNTIKIIVDGSPQGLTAYLTEPYAVPAFGRKNAGFPIYQNEHLAQIVTAYHRRGHQLALHGNGDAAIDQIIYAVRKAQAAAPRDDARHILVHAQVLRDDQISQLGAIGLTPSFFTAHTFYWGDWHRQTLGEVRASRLSPAASAERAGLRFTLHADTPVTPINPFMLVWAATERKTRSDFLLGPEQRINRLAALRAVTIDAAWQAFRDEDIGSLEAGKLADFVVLSDDPLLVEDVREVQVDETWIGGQRYYSRTDPSASCCRPVNPL